MKGRPSSLRYRRTVRTIRSIDYAEAKRTIDILTAEIARSDRAGVIAVADPAGELIAFARMDGAPVSSVRIAANKAYSAARERKSTEEIGQKARHPQKGFEIAYFGDEKFVGWGGGVPVWRDGEVVGAIAVSGLPLAEDIRLATWAASLI
jgi:glc operon protein GlcG